MRKLLLSTALFLLPVVQASASISLKGNVTHRGNLRLMNSPFIGHVTDTTATFWARATDEVDLVVKIKEAGKEDWIASSPVKALKSNDFIAHITMTGLKPSTTYSWDILVDGGGSGYTRSSLNPQFHTYPPKGQKGKFRIAMGSCSKVDSDRSQPVWNVVREMKPDLFLWLGDNIYGDTLQAGILEELYREQRDVEEQALVNITVPQLATWDDHDFGLNDYDARHPAKAEALKAFQRYWANPSYGQPDNPGVYFKTSIGDVDIFMLDGRYHRDPSNLKNQPGKTMLGKKQLEWLKEGLKSSKATFKLLATGTPWNDLKGPTGDAWSGYGNERAELFDFIKANNVGGVILLSGDTHVAELNVLPWANKGGYDFYELVSSPLGRDTTPATLFRMGGVKRVRPVYDGDRNAGFIDIDTTATPPSLTYMVYSRTGKPVWQTPFTVTSVELKNGVSSWQKKMGK